MLQTAGLVYLAVSSRVTCIFQIFSRSLVLPRVLARYCYHKSSIRPSICLYMCGHADWPMLKVYYTNN